MEAVAGVIEILLNDVTLDGIRRVRVVSDESPIPYPIDHGTVRTWSDDALGLHYLEAMWPCREAIKIKLEGWKCSRKMVLWKLNAGDRASEGFKGAFAVYVEIFKCFPDYAFMKRLPKGIENGFEISDVMFMEAEWVPPGCIAVSEGEHNGLEAMALQK